MPCTLQAEQSRIPVQHALSACSSGWLCSMRSSIDMQPLDCSAYFFPLDAIRLQQHAVRRRQGWPVRRRRPHRRRRHAPAAALRACSGAPPRAVKAAAPVLALLPTQPRGRPLRRTRLAARRTSACRAARQAKPPLRRGRSQLHMRAPGPANRRTAATLPRRRRSPRQRMQWLAEARATHRRPQRPARLQAVPARPAAAASCRGGQRMARDRAPAIALHVSRRPRARRLSQRMQRAQGSRARAMRTSATRAARRKLTAPPWGRRPAAAPARRPAGAAGRRAVLRMGRPLLQQRLRAPAEPARRRHGVAGRTAGWPAAARQAARPRL
jgi:hypothetical protein